MNRRHLALQQIRDCCEHVGHIGLILENYKIEPDTKTNELNAVSMSGEVITREMVRLSHLIDDLIKL